MQYPTITVLDLLVRDLTVGTSRRRQLGMVHQELTAALQQDLFPGQARRDLPQLLDEAVYDTTSRWGRPAHCAAAVFAPVTTKANGRPSASIVRNTGQLGPEGTRSDHGTAVHVHGRGPLRPRRQSTRCWASMRAWGCSSAIWRAKATMHSSRMPARAGYPDHEVTSVP